MSISLDGSENRERRNQSASAAGSRMGRWEIDPTDISKGKRSQDYAAPRRAKAGLHVFMYDLLAFEPRGGRIKGGLGGGGGEKARLPIVKLPQTASSRRHIHSDRRGKQERV